MAWSHSPVGYKPELSTSMLRSLSSNGGNACHQSGRNSLAAKRILIPWHWRASDCKARVADATAFHEVQHLIDQADEIQEPEWFGTAVTAFGKATSNKKMREHILWELSAFFTHLAYAGELQGVILNDLTAIALDPMLQNQPHFYSVRIILPILHEQLEGEFSGEILPARTLAEVARAYKALATNAEQISNLAKEAYQRVFERPLPELDVTRLPPRNILR